MYYEGLLNELMWERGALVTFYVNVWTKAVGRSINAASSSRNRCRCTSVEGHAGWRDALGSRRSYVCVEGPAGDRSDQSSCGYSRPWRGKMLSKRTERMASFTCVTALMASWFKAIQCDPYDHWIRSTLHMIYAIIIAQIPTFHMMMESGWAVLGHQDMAIMKNWPVLLCTIYMCN